MIRLRWRFGWARAVADRQLRPVIDPGIGEDDRRVLARMRTDQLTARTSAPPSRRRRRLTGSPLAPDGYELESVTNAALVGGTFAWLGGFGWMAGAVGGLPRLVLPSILIGAIGAAAVAGNGLWVLAILVTGGRLKEPDKQHVARLHHGRYLLPGEDLDAPARVLMARAQRAIDTVLHAEIGKLGLLDIPANTVALKAQEWEIADALYEQTQRRAQHQRATRHAGALTAEVRRGQGRVLKQAVKSVTARIEALEDYARQIRSADAAYLDWRQANELADTNEGYLQLLARTVRDELGIRQINELGESARNAGHNLRASLRQARQSANLLGLPMPGPDSSRTGSD